MQDLDGACSCYEMALKFNQWSVPAMQGIACILRTKDHFPQAVEYLRTILKVDPANGEVWGSLGKLLELSKTMCPLTTSRPLLFDDGRLATGVFSLPASLVSFVGPQGKT